MIELSNNLPKSELPIRLLHVNSDLEHSPVLFEDLVLGLDPSAYDQTVIYLYGDPSTPARLAHAGIKVIPLGLCKGQLRGLKKFLHIRRIARIIRERQPDIIHPQRHKSTVLAVVAARLADSKARILTTVHGEARSRNWRRYLLNLWILRRLHRIVACSEAVRQDVLRNNAWLPHQKVATIVNGINTAQFALSGVSRQDARREMGLEPIDGVFIGTAQRMSKRKDQPTLIRAFAQFSADRPDARLFIAGDGPRREELKKLTSELGLSDCVVFLGQIEKMPHFLRALDVFVLSTLSEGLPRALLEAMASGTPCIATDAGGNAEAINSSEVGTLLAPGDIQGMATAMTRHVQMTQSGPDSSVARRAREHFDTNIMIQRTESLYRELASRVLRFRPNPPNGR